MYDFNEHEDNLRIIGETDDYRERRLAMRNHPSMFRHPSDDPELTDVYDLDDEYREFHLWEEIGAV